MFRYDTIFNSKRYEHKYYNISVSCGGDPNAVARCLRCGELNKCSERDDDLEMSCIPRINFPPKCTSCVCKSGYKELYGRCIPIVDCRKETQ